ncbi:MAG: tRNA pseudouridine(38-40) synthase TruA [Planctomycetota bacterium]
MLEESLEKLTGRKTPVAGSGRTDSGVHALGQAASFHLGKDFEEEVLHKALNAHLPRDIRVVEARRVPDDFHARFSAKHKTYFYQILEGEHDDPFRSRFFHRLRTLPELERFRTAASALVGERDFAALQAAGSDVKNTRRRVHAIRVQGGKGWIRVYFTADGFLYRMVRNMIALITAQACGEISPEEAERILSEGDRRLVPATFPAKGLFLWRVSY